MAIPKTSICQGEASACVLNVHAKCMNQSQNSLYEKIDDWFLSVVTKMTRYYVAKKKFTKHKYDLFLLLRKLEMVAWLTVLAVNLVIALIQKEYILAGLAGTMIVVISLFEISFMKMVCELKEHYDWLFLMRHHPEVHNHMKQALEARFEEERGVRKFYLALDFFLLFYFAIALPWLIPIALFAIYKTYIHYVFDFDEPDDDDKEPDRSLSEVMRQAFENLIGNMRPTPI